MSETNIKSSICLRYPVKISTRHLRLEHTAGTHLCNHSLAHLSTIQFSIWYEPLLNTHTLLPFALRGQNAQSNPFQPHLKWRCHPVNPLYIGCQSCALRSWHHMSLGTRGGFCLLFLQACSQVCSLHGSLSMRFSVVMKGLHSMPDMISQPVTFLRI